MNPYFKIILLFSVLSFSYCKQWEVPAHLVGKWQCKQVVTVRSKQNGKYVFIHAPDSVILQFEIDDKGNITGKLGNAVFKNCKVQKNRNDLGRKMNIATDFVVKGNLSGLIFSDDPNPEKSISAPFNVTANKMTGSLFQLFGLDLYPISDFEAKKQP